MVILMKKQNFTDPRLKKMKWKDATYNYNKIEDHIISEDGTLYNTKTNKIVKSRDNVKGKDRHQRVSIKNKSYYLSRIVAEAFVPNDNPETNKIVRHLDDDPYNNYYTNLKWGTPRENTWDAIRNGKIVYDENRKYSRGELHGNRVLDAKDVKKIIKLLNKSVPLKKISEDFNVDIDVIRHIYKGNSWRCLSEKYLPFPEQKTLRKPFDPKVKKKIIKYLKKHPTAKATEITEALKIENTGTVKAIIQREKRKLLSSTTRES